MSKSKEFKIKELQKEKVTILTEEVEKVETDQFVVFRASRPMLEGEVESFMSEVSRVFTEKKVLLFPPHIEACEFVEE